MPAKPLFLMLILSLPCNTRAKSGITSLCVNNVDGVDTFFVVFKLANVPYTEIHKDIRKYVDIIVLSHFYEDL